MSNTGKLIVLYGINNLGKSTQAKLLLERLKSQNITAEYLKYAIYDLDPSGPLLNESLRAGNPHKFSAREFQLLQVINRTQYDHILREKLKQGTWIIAEDYTQTGVARGMGNGIEQDFLQRLNKHLCPSDLAFFFDGERFSSGIEKNHQHESNDTLMQKVREIHQKLAQEQGRIPINANLSISEIQLQLQEKIASTFFSSKKAD